jgi:hypothetical protein
VRERVYLSGPDQADGDDGRPFRTLTAFCAATVDPGHGAEVTVRIPARGFARCEPGG